MTDTNSPQVIGSDAGIDPVRLQKLQELRADGRDPFAIERFDRTHTAAEAASLKEAVSSQGEDAEPINVTVAGRVTNVRIMGKAAFLDITDQSGRIQIYAKKDELGEAIYGDIKKRIDLGDFLGVSGFVFLTRTGELTIHAKSAVLLAKALRNLPIGKEYESAEGEEKASGALKDTELRYRQRYVDLNVNKAARDVLIKRIKVTSAVRSFLDGAGYLEVETPVLQAVAGGAAAKPFMTHHNALDLELHLRISLELYLKRLIVGGLEKVYEIGRVFRNEGVSTRHNPEFTLLELYEAYTDLDGMMDLVERMFRHVCQAVNGCEQFDYLGDRIDFAPAFERLPILEGIRKYAGIAPEAFVSLESAHEAMDALSLSTEKEPTVGGIIEKLHERFTQPNLIQPTFITDFPLETSPLAKKRADNPALVRRFEIYVGRAELGNAFSEINDPLDQRDRFEKQLAMRAAGDDEAHPMDEDYLRALEYGMPPTGGFGAGIDRLAIMLSGAKSIRDVILFPLLRPE